MSFHIPSLCAPFYIRYSFSCFPQFKNSFCNFLVFPPPCYKLHYKKRDYLLILLCLEFLFSETTRYWIKCEYFISVCYLLSLQIPVHAVSRYSTHPHPPLTKTLNILYILTFLIPRYFQILGSVSSSKFVY
jgi:hypothetical protein